MLTKISMTWRIIIAVILLLAIINPSLTSFKEKVGIRYARYCRREANFLIFSIYIVDVHYSDDLQDDIPGQYLGIGLNFISLQ